MQEGIWHLTETSITTTSEATSTKASAQKDLEAARECLRTLLKALFQSFSQEGSTLFADLLSLIRTSLSDAFEAVEGTAGRTKEGLRRIESEAQEGKRDQWGRDKERLEEEKDPKVAWEHGVEQVKGAGSRVIEGAQGAQDTLAQHREKAKGEMEGRYLSVCPVLRLRNRC